MLLLPPPPLSVSLCQYFYWLSLFAAPCKGFCDLLVFVITNDLSSERLQGSGPTVSGVSNSRREIQKTD